MFFHHAIACTYRLLDRSVVLLYLHRLVREQQYMVPKLTVPFAAHLHTVIRKVNERKMLVLLVVVARVYAFNHRRGNRPPSGDGHALVKNK